MNVTIIPSPLCGEVDAIASKSYAHRIIIAAALCDEPTKIFLNTSSEDIEATIECIKALGAKVTKEDGAIKVIPITTVAKSPLLDCCESGSTARFLLPVAAVLCDSFTMIGKGRLPERPFTPLTEQMKLHGTKIDSDSLPMNVSEKLVGGDYKIAGNISSQYITGLLFSLPLCKEKSTITLTTKLESSAYVDITIEVLKKFGVEIEKTDYGFSINPQKFTSPGEITVEGDWSNAAFWIAADEICGNVKINGMNYDSIQGDKRILEDKKSIEIDAREIPDLVPILSVIALARKGRTKIFNAERLRIKESDRLTAICKSLGALGADIEELSDGLIINGTGTLKGGICDGFNDHRIVMSAAIASLISTDSVTIKGAEAVNKSYPRFFDDFKALGGKIVIE